MGYNIQIRDAKFKKSLKAVLPFDDNLVGYWHFGAGLDDGRINRVTGLKSDLINSPVVVDGALIADKANGISTGVVTDGEKTLISVAKTNGNGIYVGTMDYDDSTHVNADGIAVYDNRPMVQLNRAPSARIAETDKIIANNTYFIAGAIDNIESVIYVNDGSGFVTEQNPDANKSSDKNPLHIGGWGQVSTALVGTLHVYATLVYNRKLSSDEIGLVYDYLHERLSVFRDTAS